MSSFIIKIIAIITMFIDHSGDVLVGQTSVLNIIGRIAFPLFAFQLVVGYKNTSNLKKYAIRLLIFALLSQIPFSILIYIIHGSLSGITLSQLPSAFINNIISGNFPGLNIFFTLFLGLLSLFIFDKVSNKFFKYLSLGIVLIIAHFTQVDYGAWGVFLILFIYLFCPNKHIAKNLDSLTLRYFIFVLGFFALSIFNFISFFAVLSTAWVWSLILFTFLPCIFMLLFNGKKGPSLKYLFYLFYPVHLIILDMIYFFKI